jgi:hypothetical protein
MKQRARRYGEAVAPRGPSRDLADEGSRGDFGGSDERLVRWLVRAARHLLEQGQKARTSASEVTRGARPRQGALDVSRAAVETRPERKPPP